MRLREDRLSNMDDLGNDNIIWAAFSQCWRLGLKHQVGAKGVVEGLRYHAEYLGILYF
jgi:hypothetical protein